MKFKEFDETNPAPNEFAADMVKGDFYITPGVVNKFKPSEVRQVVLRHMRLDWQDMDPEDRSLNLAAAMEGTDRVLGAYRIHVTREQDTADMLEAIRRADQQLDYGQCDTAQDIIRAAISKATGEKA